MKWKNLTLTLLALVLLVLSACGAKEEGPRISDLTKPAVEETVQTPQEPETEKGSSIKIEKNEAEKGEDEEAEKQAQIEALLAAYEAILDRSVEVLSSGGDIETRDGEMGLLEACYGGTGVGYCQPFTDGPVNNPDNPIEETYIQLMASAKRFLYITTPYYAVEDSMQKALYIAADAGVDVRLLVPAVPDHKLTYLVAETYWGELLRHGVKIYKYTPGFLHAKSVMVDREVALIGSTNMDYRTFQLHYECGVLLYHMPVVEELLEDLDNIMGQSTRYTLEEWEKRPWYRRIFASLLRLGAIWL